MSTQKNKLKRTSMIAIAFLAMLVIAAACSDSNNPNPNEPEKIYPITVEPVSIECDYLDSIFSKPFTNLPQGAEGSVLVSIINSKKELDAINPFGFDVDCIDFSKYTLIGGYARTNNTPARIHHLSLREEKNNYSFHIEVRYGFGRADDYVYFWKLYPKLKAHKNVSKNITMGYEDEQ